MNWPHEVSFAQTIQIPVSVLYYICLFYCFVNWTPEAPYIPASSVYAAVQAQNQIQNLKNQKNKYKKNSKLHAKYKVPVLFAALLFFLFKTMIVLTSFFFSPLSWGQLKLKVEEYEKRIYCYSVILFSLIKI